MFPSASSEQVLHVVLRKAVRIVGVIAVTDESPTVAVQLEDAGTVRSEP